MRRGAGAGPLRLGTRKLNAAVSGESGPEMALFRQGKHFRSFSPRYPEQTPEAISSVEEPGNAAMRFRHAPAGAAPRDARRNPGAGAEPICFDMLIRMPETEAMDFRHTAAVWRSPAGGGSASKVFNCAGHRGAGVTEDAHCGITALDLVLDLLYNSFNRARPGNKRMEAWACRSNGLESLNQ